MNQVPKLVEHKNVFIAASHGRSWLCNKLWILDLAAVGAGEPAEILLGISNNGNLTISGALQLLCHVAACGLLSSRHYVI